MNDRGDPVDQQCQGAGARGDDADDPDAGFMLDEPLIERTALDRFVAVHHRSGHRGALAGVAFVAFLLSACHLSYYSKQPLKMRGCWFLEGLFEERFADSAAACHIVMDTEAEAARAEGAANHFARAG
jgi:hypothetical protein